MVGISPDDAAATLKIADIDSGRMLIRVEQGTRIPDKLERVTTDRRGALAYNQMTARYVTVHD